MSYLMQTVKNLPVNVDEYLKKVLIKYRAPTGMPSRGYQASQQIYPIIQSWAGDTLLGAYSAGSFAKASSIRNSTDIDLLISLDPKTKGTPEEIYERLFRFVNSRGFHPTKKNISIGLKINDLSIDLIPAKKRDQSTDLHIIWKNLERTVVQTNVQYHNDFVRYSGRIDEIKLAKIWCNLYNLEFPPFYLELTVIDALYHRPRNQLSSNFQIVLKYLQETFVNSVVKDPANSRNIVSVDLTVGQKNAISEAAYNSLEKEYWEKIIL
ncbi:MAG TPA: hypothetical protein VET47_00030 [Candidatus Limnocylindrales bacterium]|nr:hypothetical protein [Candidatus Limnocylindrales bacterium]